MQENNIKIQKEDDETDLVTQRKQHIICGTRPKK